MNRENPLVVRTQMLIRRPVEEVFEALVNPDITTRFWFTKSTGRLKPNQEVRWDWEMFGVSAEVTVKALEQNRQILMEWDTPPCPVEWVFAAREDRTTVVTVSNWGFPEPPRKWWLRPSI